MTAIGIDLGTTYSAVTVYDPRTKSARVLRSSEGQTLTPSVVGVHTNRDTNVQTYAVGTPAVNWALLEAKDTVFSVKRLMGRDFLDETVVEASKHASYDIVPGPGQDPRAHVVICDQVYTPVQVSTMILEKLVTDAGAQLSEPPTHAVITVPAYFGEQQRAATREAGEAAGLVVKRIIDEPTAAAVAFGVELKEGEKRRILVYDLGGGTFDISILEAIRDPGGRNHFLVRDFSGDNWLGGDDFDLLIVKRIIAWVRDEYGLDPSQDKQFLYKAKYEAEKAKRMLSQTQVVDIIIPAAYRTDDRIVDIALQLTRDEYEDMIAGLVDKTIDLVRGALARQKLAPDDISDVLLAGGSTLTPRVYESVEALFGRDKVRRDVDPVECVAIGAGILAGTQTGIECGDPACATVNDESASVCTACSRPLVDSRAVGETNLYEVTGPAIGIAAVHGMNPDAFVAIIPRGTPYPMTQARKQTFEATDGRRIVVPVYEGDSDVASRNSEIGCVEYPLPYEIPVRTKVDVEFLYDRNRTIAVSVNVPGTDLRHIGTLRYDAPRASSEEATVIVDPEPADEAELMRQDLLSVVETMERFQMRYQPYVDSTRSVRIQRDLEGARRVLSFPEPDECRVMIKSLRSHLFESGLASQLYLAEGAADRATPQDAERIFAAVAIVRAAYQEGRRQEAEDKARLLKGLITEVSKRTDVPEIRDAEDFGGLLRILDS